MAGAGHVSGLVRKKAGARAPGPSGAMACLPTDLREVAEGLHGTEFDRPEQDELRSRVRDAEGAGVISSSFADEVFGRLFLGMGPRAFMTRIEMRNVDSTFEGLIDRAIVQRIRLGNGVDAQD